VLVTEEDEYFPQPRELRDLLGGIDAVVSLTLGGPPPPAALGDDRQLAASDVLDALAG